MLQLVEVKTYRWFVWMDILLLFAIEREKTIPFYLNR
jgi:hypothetical protein